jgi:hypothetical protein
MLRKFFTSCFWQRCQIGLTLGVLSAAGLPAIAQSPAETAHLRQELESAVADFEDAVTAALDSMQEGDDAGCEGDVLFRHPGPFVPTAGADESERFRHSVTLSEDVGELVVTLDVTPGPWSRLDLRGNHNIFWLHRVEPGIRWAPNVVGYFNLFGRGESALARLSISDGEGLRKKTRRLGFAPGTGKWSVRYVLDIAAGSASLYVTSPDGEEQDLTLRADTLPDLLAGDELQLVLGHTTSDSLRGGSEVPTHGWEYSNICVRGPPSVQRMKPERTQ